MSVKDDEAIAESIELVGQALNAAMNSNQAGEDAVVGMRAWGRLQKALDDLLEGIAFAEDEDGLRLPKDVRDSIVLAEMALAYSKGMTLEQWGQHRDARRVAGATAAQ